MPLLRMLREAKAGVRAARRQRAAAAAAPGDVDRKLDDIDARLARTVETLAATLEQRAALEKQQREMLRRTLRGRHEAPGT